MKKTKREESESNTRRIITVPYGISILHRLECKWRTVHRQGQTADDHVLQDGVGQPVSLCETGAICKGSVSDVQKIYIPTSNRHCVSTSEEQLSTVKLYDAFHGTGHGSKLYGVQTLLGNGRIAARTHVQHVVPQRGLMGQKVTSLGNDAVREPARGSTPRDRRSDRRVGASRFTSHSVAATCCILTFFLN